jgi:flagellar biosynthesis protein FliQ
VAAAATYLSIGLFRVAAGVVLYFGLFASIQGATGSINPATAAFVGKVVTTSALDLIYLGFVAWGFGRLVYAILSWKSRILPSWLTIVGLVGGVASFLRLVPVAGFVLPLVLPFAFLAWALVSGLVFLGPYFRPTAS